MRNVTFLLLACWTAFISPAFAADDAAPAPSVQEKDVLPFLEQLITWRRQVVESDITPGSARETLLRDTLRGAAKKALQNGFAFSHAEASILATPTPRAPDPAASQQVGPNMPANATKDTSRRARLLARASETDAQLDSLQEQMDTLNDELARARGDTRSALLLKQETLQGQTKLAAAQRELLKTLLGIYSASSEDAGGLLGKINRIEHSIADDTGDAASAKDAKPEAKGAAEQASASHTDSLLDSTSMLFALSGKSRELDRLGRQTRDMADTVRGLLQGLRTSLQEAMKQGAALGGTQTASDAKSMKEYHKTLDALVARYRLLSSAVVPLGQASMTLENAQATLKEWSDAVRQQWQSVLQHFLLRTAVLAFSLLVPWVCSELAKRATLRYVHDAKRQRQLKFLRQALFGTVLVLMILLNFVTEFGSLATYAGFLTAGIAVALQTVLLSLTAHFFFFGRFGVRAGDRVTISGVTGDVVQIGILRIYLMELVGDEYGLRPSGKIVAFPNSVLFNATAFSKQVSGANYTWKELTFLIDPACDFSLASQKIMEAVDGVYKEYKEAVELQHTALVESTRLSVKVPAPKSELRFINGGLACVAHYPIIPKRASEIQARLTTQLLATFRADPALRLVIGNPLKIVAVAAESPGGKKQELASA